MQLMTQNKLKILVRDFSISPGPRYISEGPWSGEKFRTEFLEPELKKAISEDKKLVIDLDGTLGYGTSWLEEVFGGLIRTGFNLDEINKYLELISTEESYLLDDINEYLKDA